MEHRFSNIAQVLTCSLAALSLAATLTFCPAAAADKATAEGLRSAFLEAARDAKLTDELDPAYELLGIAEAAQQQDIPQLAAEAAGSFADLVKRAAAKALKTGGALAEVTLDQFVDLRFMARTANLTLPQSALDDAMTKLFPSVRTSLETKFNQAAEWAGKRAAADELADLQASATQLMNDDLAGDMGAAFDRKTAELETLAGQAEDEETRTQMHDALAESRKLRDDRVADAKTNNINAVAALMQNQREDGASSNVDTQ